MIELFMSCILGCCTHVFSNDRQWLQEDVDALRSAQPRCIAHYPASPCLVKFAKREPLTYWATCGKDNHIVDYSAFDDEHNTTLYNSYCARCHGNKGQGDGPNAHMYSPRPRNLAKDPFSMGDSVQAIMNTVKNGFNQMPSFEYLTDDERHDIAVYVRGFRK